MDMGILELIFNLFMASFGIYAYLVLWTNPLCRDCAYKHAAKCVAVGAATMFYIGKLLMYVI